MNNIYDKCKHCGFAFTCEQRLDEDHLTESQSLDLLSIIHGIGEKQCPRRKKEEVDPI